MPQHWACKNCRNRPGRRGRYNCRCPQCRISWAIRCRRSRRRSSQDKSAHSWTNRKHNKKLAEYCTSRSYGALAVGEAVKKSTARKPSHAGPAWTTDPGRRNSEPVRSRCFSTVPLDRGLTLKTTPYSLSKSGISGSLFKIPGNSPDKPYHACRSSAVCIRGKVLCGVHAIVAGVLSVKHRENWTFGCNTSICGCWASTRPKLTMRAKLEHV